MSAVGTPHAVHDVAASWLPPMRVEHVARPKRPVVLAVVPLVLLSGMVLMTAQRAMVAGRGHVPPGIVVAGSDLSGLPLADAATRVRGAAAPLDQPVTIRLGDDVLFSRSRRDLGATDNAAAVVHAISGASSELGVLDWVGIRWFGRTVARPVDLRLEPAPAEEVLRLASEIAAQVDRAPSDAQQVHDGESITFVAETDGVRLDRAAAVAVLTQVFGTTDVMAEDPEVDLPVVRTPATVRLDAFGQVLYLDQSEHRLELHEGGALLGAWTVATGARGFGTPTGEYWVEEKREHPTWGNPSPDGWGSGMPAFIGPGPSNPLGLRAINWGGTDHIRFHGTTDIDSLGTDASHGCVRMANEDVVELFDLVEVGATIISVE